MVVVVLFLSIEEFIPLLRERMNVLNPYVRQFLVGWITVLDSVPDIDMLGFLPDFLDGKCLLFQDDILLYSGFVLWCSWTHNNKKIPGLFNMLSDSSHEIRQQADSALSEFLQEIKNSPVRCLLTWNLPFFIDVCINPLSGHLPFPWETCQPLAFPLYHLRNKSNGQDQT